MLLLQRKALQTGTSAGAVLFFGSGNVPVPILVPVFSTQPEQSTSLSLQPPWKNRSGVPVKTQRFLVLFLFFLHHLLFSFRNIGTQSHHPWQDKCWWPFQLCSGLQFGPEHLSKIGNAGCFSTIYSCSFEQRRSWGENSFVLRWLADTSLLSKLRFRR